MDLRALTKTPPPSRVADREEALAENMTLAIESARAIGCAVNDSTEHKLLQKDVDTCRKLLIDLVKVRMWDEIVVCDAVSTYRQDLFTGQGWRMSRPLHSQTCP